jgi:succinyl-CoA synthetase beta subunit
MRPFLGRTILQANMRRMNPVGAKRSLNVHEYVSMDVMRTFGIPVPRGGVATNIDEVSQLYKTVIGEGKDCVIKAMVLAGGRGLGHFSNGFKGGVHLCSKPGDVQEYASKMLGHNLITKQTTAAGLPCTKVMLAERMYMRREMYISIMLDRSAGGPVFIASPAGGTSIEDVAAATPELIFKQPVNIMEGITDAQSTFLATSLGFEPGSKQHAECKSIMEKIYQMFRAHDCTLVEVNPLAETPDGRVVVCDGKISFDDNAEFRQGSVFKLRDRSQEDIREVEAAKHDLNYIGLTGNIGCMVNGAGLAMATMDIIKLKGGDPANFLDVGGGASESQVQKAFELLNADKQVKTILVNIFGGIMRCDVIAMGIINAAQNIGMKKPIIIRLKGTNVEEAKKLIEASGFRLIVTDDLEDAANKAVHIAEIVKQAEEVALSVEFGAGEHITPL